MGKVFIKQIKELSIREKQQFELAEKQSNGIELIDERVKLEFELTDLKNELWHIERKQEV